MGKYIGNLDYSANSVNLVLTPCAKKLSLMNDAEEVLRYLSADGLDVGTLEHVLVCDAKQEDFDSREDPEGETPFRDMSDDILIKNLIENYFREQSGPYVLVANPSLGGDIERVLIRESFERSKFNLNKIVKNTRSERID